jgi:long-chain acyl-CoA synthetase
MLTHANFCFEVRTARETLGVGDRDNQLLFLPLAHILGKVLYIIHLEIGGTISFAENMLRALDNAADINPTFFGSVPRVFEKFQQVADKSARQEGPLREKTYRWALEVGRRMAAARRSHVTPPLSLVVQHRYADRLVLRPLRNRFGRNIRFAISGGAPLSKSVGEWFEAIGMTILEGYGLTESTGAANVNRPDHYKFGTVGPVLEGVEVKIAEDGEIMVKGPNVALGYYNNPEATRAAFVDDWFYTGDIGELDSDNYLKITDRKKDLIVTAGGKNIAPQHLENLLKMDKYITEVMLYGDRKKFISALVVPDFEKVEEYALKHDILFVDVKGLVENPEIRAMIGRRIEKVEEAHQIPNYERIKKFIIMSSEFSMDNNEVTPTLKLKRKIVTARFQQELDALYEE